MKLYNCLCQVIATLTTLAVLALTAVPSVLADTVVCFPLDTDPGWSIEAQWAFGIPLGRGSHCGDPTSGYTGANVYGYNLGGDYTNGMPAYRLTTTSLNCSGHGNVTLNFWRWLGVESASFDHANVAVSNNGSTWTSVWEHTGDSFCDGDWVECTYDISAVADNQPTVYIRWTMGPTDGFLTYPGWNIDDICLFGDPIDDLRIAPPERFSPSGPEGGLFTPSNKIYTLTNNGPSTLSWTADVTQPWLDVDPNAGVLDIGDSNTVELSLNANASGLPQGMYSDTVTFTNTSSGITQTREVILEVFPAGTIFFDTFPLKTLDGAKWTICGGIPTIDDVGIGEPSLPYSLRFNGDPGGGDCIESRVLNLSGSGRGWFTYWYQRTGEGEHSDPGEDLIIDYWDGSTWVELDRQLGGGVDMTDYNEVVLELPSGAYHANFRFRISNTASACMCDDWFVDDIWVIMPDDLSVSPLDDFNSFGYEGGPFTPAYKTYTLSNINRETSGLDWTASATQPWLSVEPSSGTLNPSDSNMVSVTLNANANTLPPGDYNDIVTFTNINSGFVQRRNVCLQVIVVPGEIEVTDSIPSVSDLNMPFGDVFIGLSWTEKITITNTDPCHSLYVTGISLRGPPTSAVETTELLVKLPGIAGGAGGFNLSYLPTGWVTPERPASKLLISSGYRVLTDGIDVLLLASGNDPTILRTALAAFPDIETVDYFNCLFAAPTEADLAPYDTVVVMSEFAFFDATRTGNVLADYVDAGGKVIQAVATFGSGGGWELGGRFITQPGYEPFAHGWGEFYPHSLGVFDAEHPIMDGVNALTDGLPAGVALEPDAEWVADWDNGTPLVATQGSNVVGINIFAFDPGDFTGDVPLLFHNAIVWLAEGTAEGFELTGLPELPVSIPSLDHLDVNVVFKPTEVKACAGAVVIKSNDDDEPEIEVQLSGSGVLDYLEIIPDANLEFSGHPGGPFVPTYEYYQLTNIGPINIDWTVYGPNWLDVYPSSGTLKPGEATTVTVGPNLLAETKEQGTYNGEMIFTNVTTTVEQVRNVILNVYTDPKIWARPYYFDVTVSQGGTATEILTIGNTGDASLSFTVSGRQIGFT
ncbi:MAG: BACON domain-containing protein, partial [Planctomycetota bacterium]